MLYIENKKFTINFSVGLKPHYQNVEEPMYQEAYDRFKAFIKEKHDWEAEMYLYPSHDLLRYVRDTLQNSEDTATLLQQGTETEMETFMEGCAAHANQLLPVIMQNVIYCIYMLDCEDKPFSKTIISWFRKKQWNFPLLPHEGGKKAHVKPHDNQSNEQSTTTNDLNSSEDTIDKIVSIDPDYKVKE